MPGPPPKPSAIKAAEGNPGHQKLSADALLPAREPSAPGWLSESARGVWDSIVDHLMDLGVLQFSDQLILAQLCDAVAILLETRSTLETMPFGSRMLVKDKTGMFRGNPLVKIINDQRIIILRLAEQFGMTPAARARLMAGEMPLQPPAPGTGALSLGDILRMHPEDIEARQKPN